MGSIDCSDQLDAGYVTTELLMPIPETGTGPSEGGWHIVKTWNNHDLTPESTPSNLPTSDLVLGEYFTDKGTATMYQLFLWTPEDVDGGLINSYVSFAFWSGGQCGHDAVTRTIAYDLELETFNGAWDNPPSLNGGDYAAGYFRNHYEGDARYVCG